MRTLNGHGSPWPLWIDGRPDHDPDRPVLEARSPITGNAVGTYECAMGKDVEKAVLAAKAAELQHCATPRHERIGWLNAAADALAAHADDLVESVVELIGKPRAAAAQEVRRGPALLRQCAAELAAGLRGETLPLDGTPAGDGRLGLTWREPLGVVAAITPFNAPVNLLLQKLGPALAMGNSVIVKPAPEASIVTLQLLEVLSAAMPSGLIGGLPGGADVAQDLSTHHGVSAVSLTGGRAAGEAVLRSAGIKPVLLELGSNSPNLVLGDARVPMAARAISVAAFAASGQQCISAQRVIVEQQVRTQFIGEFVTAAGELKLGDPHAPDTDIGPMIHKAARDRVVDLIDDAVECGAQLVLDGRSDDMYLGPTILSDPEPHARILHEEVFGPVAVVLSAQDVPDAVRIANDVDGVLQAACFTSSLDDALRAARTLRAGSVWINEATRFRLDTYPFGGVGRSGIGREGVRFAMEELSSLKFVGLQLPATAQEAVEQ